MARDFAITRAEYQDLDWVVQVNLDEDFARGWESMAAFNVRGVAIKYAEDCKKTNKRLRYRVLELSKLQPTHTIIFETAARTVSA
jgi:hypothetical protein